MFPPIGSAVGENGSVNVPSGFTLRVWKAFPAGVEFALDCSLET
jgi:hypothetical protein